MTKILLSLLAFILVSVPLCAQEKAITLSCPMNDVQVKDPPTDGFGYSEPDKKVLLVSATDTSFRAPIDGKVISVTLNADRKYEIVMYHGDYYFWVIGIEKTAVRKNAIVKSGQSLGLVTPGTEIEFLMFLDEAPVDPKPYLKCPPTSSDR